MAWKVEEIGFLEARVTPFEKEVIEWILTVVNAKVQVVPSDDRRRAVVRRPLSRPGSPDPDRDSTTAGLVIPKNRQPRFIALD